jgi:hypothetical protein
MAEGKNERWLQLTSHGVLYNILKHRLYTWSEKCTETEIVAVLKDSLSFSVWSVLSTGNSFWRTRLLTQPVTETERHLKQ